MSRRRGRRAILACVALATVAIFAQSYTWPDFLPWWLELSGRGVFGFFFGMQLARPLGAAIDEAAGRSD